MQRRKFLTAMGGAAITAAFAGCGGGGGGGEQGPVYGQQMSEYSGEVAATFEVTENGFDPVRAGSVPVDGTVEFVNTTDTVRNLDADGGVSGLSDWGLEAAEWQPGQSVYFTFTEAGIYAFRDNEDTRFMACGAVAVGEDNTAEDIPDLPCESGTGNQGGYSFGGSDGNSTDGNSTDGNSTDGNA